MGGELQTSSIYVHIHKTTGKAYVGQAKNPKQRWGKNGEGYTERDMRTCPSFAEAVKAEGFDAFEHKVLFTLENRTKMDICFYEALTIELFARRGQIYNQQRPLQKQCQFLDKDTMESLFKHETEFIDYGSEASVARWVNYEIKSNECFNEEYEAWMKWCNRHEDAKKAFKEFYKHYRATKEE